MAVHGKLMETKGTKSGEVTQLFDNPKLVWTYRELSREIGVPVSTLTKLVMQARIPHVKIGRLVRFQPKEIAAWLNRQRKATNV